MERPPPRSVCGTTVRGEADAPLDWPDGGPSAEAQGIPGASSIPGGHCPGIMYNSIRPSGRVEYPAMNSPSPPRSLEATARIAVPPLEDTSTFADRAYAALRDVILSLDIYNRSGEVRLDE